MSEIDAMIKVLRFAGYEVMTRREAMELRAEVSNLHAELAAIRQNPSLAFPQGRHDVEEFYSEQTDIGMSYAEVDAALRNDTAGMTEAGK